MTAEDWRRFDGGGEGLGNRLYQASRTGSTLEAVMAAAKTKRYPMARLRRMVLAAWLDLPAPPERAPYLRADQAGRRVPAGSRGGGAVCRGEPVYRSLCAGAPRSGADDAGAGVAHDPGDAVNGSEKQTLLCGSMEPHSSVFVPVYGTFARGDQARSSTSYPARRREERIS